MNREVRPDWSKAVSNSLFRSVHSWVLRAPSATSLATVERAMERADWMGHLEVETFGEPPHDLADVISRKSA